MSTPLTLQERFNPKRFFQGEAPSDEPIVLSHRRIFILPSWPGLGFLALIGLLLAVSFVYNNNLVYSLTFLLGSVFFISTLHTFQALAGIRLRAAKTRPCYVGELAEFKVYVENIGQRPRPNLQFSMRNAETVRIDLSAGASDYVTLRVKATRRGWMQLTTVTLFSFVPLGLFRAWSPLNFKQQVLVYPRPADEMLPFPNTHGESEGLGGKSPGVDDFFGLREYQAGDSIRQIHWKAYAKGQGILTKQYGGENAPELWLDWERVPGKDIEIRLSRLCRWVIDAENAGNPYGFKMPGLVLQPARGAKQRETCLEALALFRS